MAGSEVGNKAGKNEKGEGFTMREAGPESPQHLDFNTLTMSFATTVAIHLGKTPDPATGKFHPLNLPLAQQNIDILGILHEKTKGNLTSDEAQLLDRLLADLRMLYVATKNQK